MFVWTYSITCKLLYLKDLTILLIYTFVSKYTVYTVRTYAMKVEKRRYNLMTVN